MDAADQPAKRSHMGIVTYALGIHQKHGWAPTVPIEDGLRRTLHWFQQRFEDE